VSLSICIRDGIQEGDAGSLMVLGGNPSPTHGVVGASSWREILMRRILIMTTIAAATLSLLPWPAQSKGLEEHAKVAIRGPGLAEPIRLSGEDAFVFVERSGAFQAKWDVPNLGGDLKPNAELGTEYRARVRMRCWNGKLVRFTQTLYPEAPDGVQVFTPPGTGGCFGLVPGYWPASNELLSLLLTRGLPASTGEQRIGDDRSTAQAVAVDGGSGGSFGAGLAITVALAAALALLGIAVGLASRRRRGTT
jgi:hypothetical protein